MRDRVIIVVVLLGTALATFASKEDLEQLKARAASARVEDRPGLDIAIAREQVEAANHLYNAGKVDEARAAVNDAVDYSDKAYDAATSCGKKLKQTEIGVRKIAVRLRDIKRTLVFEDQAPVQAAIDHLEGLRTSLLSQMFGKKKEK